MLTTARDICEGALKEVGVLGVGQSASAEDINDAFDRLNLLLDEWSIERFMLFHLVQLSFTGDGSQTKTIGPSGDIDTVRPYGIASAFVRQNAGQPQPVDTDVWVIKAREDYNRITAKFIDSRTRAIFLDTGDPLSTLYMWPIPDSSYELHLSVVAQIENFDNLSDPIDLPKGYKSCLLYNLASRLFDMYGIAPKPKTLNLADSTKRKLQRINAQIPQLLSAIPFGKGCWDIRSDIIL